jgi:hypothetical protein
MKIFAGKPRLPLEQCCHIATNTQVSANPCGLPINCGVQQC